MPMRRLHPVEPSPCPRIAVSGRPRLHRRLPSRLRMVTLLLGLAACSPDGEPADPDAADGPRPPVVSPVESVPLSETVAAPGLSAPVDVVRDEIGVPHIYAKSFADAAFAQGYMMAADRLFMMDLSRRLADGTLSELLGELQPDLIDQDIRMRVHHLARTAAEQLQALRISPAEADRQIVASLERFAAGVNAVIAEAQAGRRKLPAVLSLLYDVKGTRPWRPEDSVVLALYQAFELSFDADSEISFSALDEQGDKAGGTIKALSQDLQILAPVDPTFTLPSGWTGLPRKSAARTQAPKAARRKPHRAGSSSMLALLLKAREAVAGLGDDRLLKPALGSNNWVIGPGLSATGRPLLANDTHLSLTNPPVFYLQHIQVTTAEREDSVLGVQFAGIPGVVLGMNRHLAWGATVSMVDVTDVYSEDVVPCDGGTGPCVMFNKKKVPLAPRKEVIAVGRFGKISERRDVLLYDVPHHGPILPRLTRDHAPEPLGTRELSVRYTGYEPAQIIRAVFALNTARSLEEATQALERDFLVGRQNWVLIDSAGRFGWTQATRIPRRAPRHAPWKILPGDGSAEWRGDLPMRYVPHAVDPAQGYLVTANADPIGVTADNDPFFSEPLVDDAPLYLGADYDPGTRAARITRRITDKTRAGEKLTLADMASIQADHHSRYGELLQPTLLAAAEALEMERAAPGSVPELAMLVAAAPAPVKALVPTALEWIKRWSFRTPSGVAEDSPTAADVTDSQATLVFAMWLSQLDKVALGDELKLLNVPTGSDSRTKLLIRMCTKPESLKTGIEPKTGDAALFDDVGTAGVTETKRYATARALIEALSTLAGRLGSDGSKWRWGQVHTVTLAFPASLEALDLPPKGDSDYPQGFPRPGGNGTVDVGPHGLSTTRFGFGFGAAMRFVCEMTPEGPRAKNALPGGQVFDPDSPHYRDQLELWRKNQAQDLAFRDDEVLRSAEREQAQRGLGRTRFQPAPGN
ncbi:MAG: penicillin acylase family protein [Polyangia bacterium]